MIGIKTFHLFFIGLSILLTGWYSYFEITTPSNPGNLSTFLGFASLLSMILLSYYGYSVYNKFKNL
jgi:divalent metal cation (Fe/Co/Zn/Cd) transporter|tara:strand:- start:270 stop:467 length:198 start_codon:yes stop_codon:yes gene_type:complete